ncbi:MAG: recombinase family protein [Hydrogenophaga sp.]
METNVIRAYSYLRFSTPEQMRGDSFRRQAALAEAYAHQHGLELDTALTFHDAGVSAFRGRNVGPEGQLGAFLDAIRSGVVPQGSYLLVESLDRISRQTARKALRSLEDVVEAGAVVVTLNDGRKYTNENLDSDQIALLLSILTFMRAHEESAMKASRLKAVWSEKRSQAVSSGNSSQACFR